MSTKIASFVASEQFDIISNNFFGEDNEWLLQLVTRGESQCGGVMGSDRVEKSFDFETNK